MIQVTEFQLKYCQNLFRHDIKTSLPGLHGEKGTGLGLPYCFDIIKVTEEN